MPAFSTAGVGSSKADAETLNVVPSLPPAYVSVSTQSGTGCCPVSGDAGSSVQAAADKTAAAINIIPLFMSKSLCQSVDRKRKTHVQLFDGLDCGSAILIIVVIYERLRDGLYLGYGIVDGG